MLGVSIIISMLPFLSVIICQDAAITINGKADDSQNFASGEVLNFSITNLSSLTFDSITINIDGTPLCSNNSPLIAWESRDKKLGRHTIEYVLLKKKCPFISLKKDFILLSDIKPIIENHKVVNTYPHDTSAYTQGLTYRNGYLIEGTGLLEKSSVRKVDLLSGTILRQYNIEKLYFGEGVTIYKEKIYQLTWKNRICFVYNLNDLSFIRSLHYPIDGWGVTCNNKEFIASNGTNILYLLDNTDFSLKDSVSVYDDKGPVSKLNELELINNIIYANIFLTDSIAKICPKTGKVLGYICLNGICRTNICGKYAIGELNGIAYNNRNNSLLVTGKGWPYLFEIITAK